LKRIWLFVGLAGMLLLSGCFNKSQKGDELIAFYNHWMENWEVDSSTYSSLSRAEDTDEMLLIIRNDILPVLRASVDYLEHADLEYRAVNNLNESLLDRETYLLELFQELTEGISSSNNQTEIKIILKKFNENMDEAADKNKEFAESLDTLMDKYNVYWITEYDSNGEELERLGKDR